MLLRFGIDNTGVCISSWGRECNHSQGESQKKMKPVPPPVGIVTIPDTPSTEQLSKKPNRPIRDLNVRLANGTYYFHV